MSLLQSHFLMTLGLICLVRCENLVMMPFDHVSHVNFFVVTAHTLVKEGHSVTFVIAPRHKKTLDKHGLNYITYDSVNADKSDDSRKAIENDVFEENKEPVSLMTTLSTIKNLVDNQKVDVLGDNGLKQQMDATEFNLAIIDGTLFCRYLYVLAYRHSIPYITLTASDDPLASGVTGLPSVQPLPAFWFTDNMSITQRLINTFAQFMTLYVLPAVLYPNSIIAEYAPNKPAVSMDFLYKQSELVLVNLQDVCLDYPRVTAPHYQMVGGMGAHHPHPLPENIESFIQGAKDGIVVMTFGSIFSKMPDRVLKKFFDAFKVFPKLRFIMRNSETTLKVPDNVLPLNWLPQNDILGHPRTILFITHGGNNCQLEAVYHGVPTLTFPLFGDQFSNAVRMRVKGFGLDLQMKTFTTESLIQNLIELTTNDTFRSKIKRCSAIVKEQTPAQEKVARWVRHVLKYGSDHLKSHSIDMPLYQLLLLDVMCIVMLGLGIVSLLLTCCCRMVIFKCCCRGRQKIKSE
ncbi:unnamed protein product [Owenia fusiformis]|uniref:Glucuronosyltransferase n=1 Tax=Owenia fusiformis TaxID=6347 RepID=A0A8S4N0L4_OWEFU|nr:unnamed protein product [Owenia fusiformis]